MDVVVGEIALVLTFIVAGGFFAGAEMALVSLRPAQVRRLAASGRRGHQVQRLLASPNRFLSAVQIGVTLAGFLSSAFGAVTLARPVGQAMEDAGVPAALAATTSVLVVTVIVAYVSLVLGELAPKRIALQRAEGVARASAPALEVLAKVFRPVIWLLGRSTDVVVRLFGADPAASREAVSEAELRDIVATNEDLTPDERQLIREVLDAGDRPIREVMTPRVDVAALSADLSVGQAAELVRRQPHSRYPVVDGGLDDVVGFVHLRDLLTPPPDVNPDTSVRTLSRPLMRLPDSRRALPAMAEMRRGGEHLALVVDEYGGGAGIVTLEDLLEELVGDITDEFDTSQGAGRRLAGGLARAARPEEQGRPSGAPSRGGEAGAAADAEAGGPGPAPGPLPEEPIEAQLRLEEFEEATGIALPEGPYDTAAGWLVAQLGRIPQVGDAADHDGVRLTVTDVRRRRVERVRLSRLDGG